MSRLCLCLFFCAALLALPVYAATPYGVGSCLPQSFPTITAAINAVPAGSVILVCPGSYPEQVVITKRLTLEGVNTGTNSASIITAPPGGTVQNSTSLATGNPIAAQVLVDGAAPVIIKNLIVDGSNNGITGCAPDLIGIYYRNSSGTVTNTAVVNQALAAALNGCQSGEGIFVQSGAAGTSTVTLSGNYVHNYQKNGITGNEVGTKVNIISNTVFGQGSTTGAAENSIQIGFGATGSITRNTVGGDIWAPDQIGDTGDAAAGILVYASSGISITGNNVSSTQFGITVDSDPVFGAADSNIIKTNKVATTALFDGIDLCSNNNTVTGNTVVGSDEAAIHIDDTCTGVSTGNTVTGNTINSACAGLLIGPGASGNTFTPNVLSNVTTLFLTGTNTCVPPVFAARRRPRGSVRPFRP